MRYLIKLARLDLVGLWRATVSTVGALLGLALLALVFLALPVYAVDAVWGDVKANSVAFICGLATGVLFLSHYLGLWE